MPIYEYACQKCGAHLEVMQKISDDSLKKHQECGGKLEKQWSQTSFQLKGAGWYVTDYAAKKNTETETKPDAEAKSDANAKPDAGDKATDKADAADTKSEPKEADAKKETPSKSEKSEAKSSTAATKESKKK